MLSSVPPKDARNNFEGGRSVVEKMVNVKFKKKAIFKMMFASIFQGGSVQRWVHQCQASCQQLWADRMKIRSWPCWSCSWTPLRALTSISEEDDSDWPRATMERHVRFPTLLLSLALFIALFCSHNFDARFEVLHKWWRPYLISNLWTNLSVLIFIKNFTKLSIS